jgi:cell division protein FtsX
VASDVKANGLDQPPIEAAYFPIVPPENGVFVPVIPLWSILIRTSAPRSTTVTGVRQVLASLEPSASVGNIRDLEEIVSRSFARTTLTADLLGVAATLALVFTAIAMYGILAYGAKQRERDFGIRLAIGATPLQIRWEVLAEGFKLTCLGLGVGIPVALWIAHGLRALLFGIGPVDSHVTALATMSILVTTLLAGYLPAARAARTNPVALLRLEQ